MTGQARERHPKLNLWGAVLAFQAEAPALQKDKINPAFRSKYLSLDTLMEQVMPLLNKHGLIWLTAPNFQAHGGQVEPNLSYRLIHAESGEETSGTVPLILAKRDMQGLGSAVTYARRYALMAVLGLVADEDDDGNTASQRNGQRNAQPTNRTLNADELGRVITAIEEAGKDLDLILGAVGAVAADELTLADARKIKALLS